MVRKGKILIVEDEFIVAYDLKTMLTKAGYLVIGIASSVEKARQLIEQKKPDWVLLDIVLKGDLSGIDLAKELLQLKIPFLFISANTNQTILEAAKATQPYGFLVKPFRERDLFVMLDIARYKHDFEMGYLKPKSQSLAQNKISIDGIIGNNPKLLACLEQISIVAPTPTSVIILGESGTGKERIAKAIHELSDRKDKPIITVNCAALPLNLIESELFGHEKGSFTGANQRRVGKFEQANDGTIFLDEIGELPLESQVKLLRVLQEKEIERIGGDSTIKVDVRIITATNRNLHKEVSNGHFRLDLYYRLNVFPIELPPLRERKEDIEILSNYFLEQFSKKLHKNNLIIGKAALEQLKKYHWLGNIRELEHLIERHVLLAKGNEISEFDLPIFTPNQTNEIDSDIKTLEEVEKDYILSVLLKCKGKVSGSGGAAELLKISAQTLFSKIKKLNIKTGYL
jgi:two-component system, NtrC family, response regulator HydG